MTWASKQGIALTCIRPGAPQENACPERDNRTLTRAQEAVGMVPSQTLRLSVDALLLLAIGLEQWRAARVPEVSLRAYASVSKARAGISRHLSVCNTRRPY